MLVCLSNRKFGGTYASTGPISRCVVLSRCVSRYVTGGGVTRMAWPLLTMHKVSTADPARESEPMLGCCWAIPRDVGPALKQLLLRLVGACRE